LVSLRKAYNLSAGGRGHQLNAGLPAARGQQQFFRHTGKRVAPIVFNYLCICGYLVINPDPLH